jgi:hypothetical protein
MSHDDLIAQARSLKTGIEKSDAEIAKLEGTLAVMKSDRHAMWQRLGSVERFLTGDGVELPYAGKAGK